MKILKTLLIIAIILVPTLNFAQSKGKKKEKVEPKVDTLSYAMGVYSASTLLQADIKSITYKDFEKGFNDTFGKKEGTMTIDEAMVILNNYVVEERERAAQEILKEGQRFLDENAKKEGVIVDESGVQYKILKLGNGPKPTATDVVKVHYHGTKIDGTVFDSSVNRGEPAEFPLNRVIKGWTIGVALMNVGSKYIFYIPSELAYGANPRQGGPIKPNEMLIFEVELLEIKK